jgi:hypothetical protein
MKVDDQRLQVMLVMTGIRQGNVRLIMAKLRSKGYAVKNRYSLQRTLKSLCHDGLLQHDLDLEIYTVNMKAADKWVRQIKNHLKDQGKIVEMIEVHVKFGSQVLYV